MKRRSSLRALLAAGIGGALTSSVTRSVASAPQATMRELGAGATSGTHSEFVTQDQLAAALAGRSDSNIGRSDIARFSANGRVVNSIQALRSLHKDAFSGVMVAGYLLPGDGGGGLYFFDAADNSSPDNGGSTIVANDGGRWKLAYTHTISVKQFGARGDNATDDSAAIQATHNYAARETLAGQFSVGGVISSYLGTTPKIIYPKGRYVISEKIACGAYLNVEGEDAIIIQSDKGKRIFEGANAFRWNVSGISFVGGSNQAYLANANTDSTLWQFENCKFVLAQDYAIRTEAIGGKYSHLSANLLLRGCLWDRSRKVLLNCCDYASISDSWIHVSKQNFGSATEAFAILNRADSGHPRLYLENVTGVPEMGRVGLDRVQQARWIDNFGDVIAVRTRFGGENAGMGIVRHYKAPSTKYPFIPTQITFENCELYAGPSLAADSCVINCVEVPKIIRIKGCQGPVDVPYLIAPTLSFPGYFDTYSLTARRPAWQHFKIEIDANGGDFAEGLIHGQRIPSGLRPYLSGAKQAIVRRATPQAIANGLVNNFVQFDTVDFENCGAFSLSAPADVKLPLGASRARIAFFARFHASFTGGAVSVRLLDADNAIVVTHSQVHGVMPSGVGVMLETDLFAQPKSHFRFSILQDSGKETSIVEARATVTVLDLVH